MSKYIYEFIGTFFLVLTIGCVVLGGVPGMVAPLPIAAALMMMIFAGGHVSGAHFNPGVTVAVLVRGRMSPKDFVPYVIAQLLGAVAASCVAMWLFEPAKASLAIQNIPAAIAGETLFSFALCFVVLNVATAKAHPNNHFYGFAIGMVVLAGAYAVGGKTGGAFNTAVAVGLGIMKIVSFSDLWIHIGANLIAGAVAGIVFKVLNPQDK